MYVCILIGTRPEIIKMSPLIRAFSGSGINFFILHTGQHYDYFMDKKICMDLEIPQPKYNLGLGEKEYRVQMANMIMRTRAILKKESPDAVFVQGDTNSVLAGAIAGSKEGIPVAHLEAGLRSHDLTMPEERNRILTDNMSDYLFTPTINAHSNLKAEGINQEITWLTGNTVVDAVKQNLAISDRKCNIVRRLALDPNRYVLVTAHRAENVDISTRLKGILDGMVLIGKKTKLTVVFPSHPRTTKQIKVFGLKIPPTVKLIKPVGYLEFLQLESQAKLIITDSGGVQEEASILNVPCVTIRDNTERPETIKGGFNILAGAGCKQILKSAQNMLRADIDWSKPNPFGDGYAGKKIVKIWQKSQK